MKIVLDSNIIKDIHFKRIDFKGHPVNDRVSHKKKRVIVSPGRVDGSAARRDLSAAGRMSVKLARRTCLPAGRDAPPRMDGVRL
ncbi:MAG: hypothetical protein AB1641_06320 [Thermodesulfobacteriota bacterium]